MNQPATAWRQTEALREAAGSLDTLPPVQALGLLAEGQAEAALAVRQALPALADAAEAVAQTLKSGGRLAYAGAGSSGLMALADALELPGTFGIPQARVLVLLAGGTAALSDLTGTPEDDPAQGATDVADSNLIAGDCLLAISASGSTPYALGALDAARVRGLRTIAIANNAGAPMFELADIPVLLPTPPEVLAGSTRMGAGTAQKIALNLISTMAAIHLGHVHGPYMVNLRADNAKLWERAARMVGALANVAPEEARALLSVSDGAVKAAILLGLGAADIGEARSLLERSGEKLRPAIEILQSRQSEERCRA